MVWMSNYQREKYERLADFIDAEIPNVTYKPKVFSAYKQYVQYGGYAGNSHISALMAFSGPRIVVRQLGRKTLGQFNPLFPDRIALDKEFVKCFEHEDHENELGRRLIECTILHELVHLFDWKADKKYAPNHSGAYDFEIAAYGESLGLKYAGWAGKKC